MSPEQVRQVLDAHQLGFMGTCVTAKGQPDCDWKARRPVERHGTYDQQHRAHQADAIVGACKEQPAE